MLSIWDNELDINEQFHIMALLVKNTVLIKRQIWE